MDVERPERRELQHRLGQEEAVGGDHDGLGRRGAQARERIGGLERLRLEQIEAARDGELLDGAGGRLAAAPRGAVGLREDQRDFVLRLQKPRQRPLGEARRPGED
jgi:hypothetical protein